ncbi:MAG: hypothetical protein ABIN20_00785 [candidate division WOR-3 bacterium]
MDKKFFELIENSRRDLAPHKIEYRKKEAEGGCGVVGFISSKKIEGKYLLKSLIQMKNRGNGKGGGICACGLDPEDMQVDSEILKEYYILQIAYLDKSVIKEIENFINYNFEIRESYPLRESEEKKELNLEITPPLVKRYFVKPKEKILSDFIKQNNLEGFDIRKIEDEFMYQKCFILNKTFYKAGVEQKAFVLSSGKDMIVLKIVGFADDVIRYYDLYDFKAHLWIGHHRYPTKGKVWHPGGAHPFSILHYALIHNGDFSNYAGIINYLAERKMYPLFLTDTEAAILLFDLWKRQYEYKMEYLLEAMAPTTERDFYLLPPEKREIYREIQISHISASPDGPWFFIIGGNNIFDERYELIGITDTSMLRPQVFAILKDKIEIGIIASERQAINAILRELKKDGIINTSYADKYWNARGGSHTDGGAYVFSYDYRNFRMIFEDKFGKRIEKEDGIILEKLIKGNPKRESFVLTYEEKSVFYRIKDSLDYFIENKDARGCYEFLKNVIKDLSYETLFNILVMLEEVSFKDDSFKKFSIDVLTYLNDLYYNVGNKRRNYIIDMVESFLVSIFKRESDNFKVIDYERRGKLKECEGDLVLVVDSLNFPPEGDDSLARFLVESYKKGYKKFIVFNLRGQRFIGCGFGKDSKGVRIDCYGDIGDYAGSGIDGLEIYIHSSGQDQMLNIMKSGKAVIYGDAGQTFMYGAKGGKVFVMGNLAGRPLINTVGNPKVVINGTCLDYLAESFMAGDPLNGGGFCILNGIRFNRKGEIEELDEVYPGSNLMSLPSGGAIYVRDPFRKIEENQLHGSKIEDITEGDLNLIRELLEENEKLFDIKIEELLRVRGEILKPEKVYRKIVPKK